MMMRPLLLAAVALAVPAAATAQPHDHARVTAASPANGATVKAPRTLSLTFSAAVDPRATGLAVVMTAMPGVANHGEMPIRNFTTRWSDGNRTATLTLKKPLGPGSYDLRWQTAGADGHAMTGTIRFVVR